MFTFALPAYLGGKRRELPLIFAALSQSVPSASWPELIFLDPFSGGGSVALYAKYLGFRVMANDLALRAVVTMRALVENSEQRLSAFDIARLLEPPTGPHPRIAELEFSPSVFRLEHARILDGALARAGEFAEPKRSLAVLVIIKAVLRLFPMSLPSATDAGAANCDDFDRISHARLPHYVRARSGLTLPSLLRIGAQVNSGVFPGRGGAHRGDAIAFLRETTGDIVFIDPPYARTTGYERAYAALDRLLGDDHLEGSPFSSSAPPLKELFAATAHIPVLVLSYGNTLFQRADLEALLVDAGRQIECSLELPYRHLASVASVEKNRTNREVLIVARNRRTLA